MKYSTQEWVILFGGAGRQAVVTRLVNEGVPIRVVFVPARKSWKLEESIAILAGLNVSIKDVGRNDLFDVLYPYSDCNLLSIGFPYIIPKVVFSRHSLALNIHPTLLPSYRGPTTGAYILINGEVESGSTVHLLEEEVDKGSVIAQSKVELTPFDTLRSLQRKVYEREPDLMIKALQLLESGHKPIPQDEAAATSYPKNRKPEDSELDPSKPLRDLVNEIRASDPDEFPAFFYYKGQKICVKLWRPEKSTDRYDEL